MYVNMGNNLIRRFSIVLPSVETLRASGIIHCQRYGMDYSIHIPNLDFGHLKEIAIMILWEHKRMP
jgi:hypothetical protein